MNRTVKLMISLAGAVAGISLFARFPDMDISLLGIGAHRNFLFHSAIVPVIAVAAVRRWRLASVLSFAAHGFLVGASVSVGFHLLQDTFQSAPVKFPIIGSLVDGTSIDDRLWLSINSLVCFVMSFFKGMKIYLTPRVDR
jgi:hypothetical protein